MLYRIIYPTCGVLTLTDTRTTTLTLNHDPMADGGNINDRIQDILDKNPHIGCIALQIPDTATQSGWRTISSVARTPRTPAPSVSL